jgi:Uma2 family endonuclease
MNRPAPKLEADHAARQGFAAEDFLAIAEAGAFDSISGRVELIEGAIVRMSPAKNLHFHYTRKLFRALDALFGDGRDGWIAGIMPTIGLSDATVCDPDVAIVRAECDLDSIFEAGDALLVAEIADTSLKRDRTDKRRLYAEAGVPHYWIVDVKGRRVECLAEPEGGDYRSERVYAFGDPIPVPGADAEIRLD